MSDYDPTEEWGEEPTASEADVRLVLTFLRLVKDLDNVAAAEEIGVKEGTIRRWRKGDVRPLRKRTRSVLRRYTEAGHRRPAAGVEEEIAGTTTVVDPNTARRAVRAIDPSDMKTRLAIIREYEDVYVEAGYPPGSWPQWFLGLRREVYGADDVT